jgi:hypothetical protein
MGKIEGTCTHQKEKVVFMFDLGGFEVYLRSKELSSNTVSCYIRDSKVFIGW